MKHMTQLTKNVIQDAMLMKYLMVVCVFVSRIITV